MVWVYGVLFAVVTAVHLFSGKVLPEALRAPTKPMILLCILGMYLEWMHLSGFAPSATVIAALLTSLLGDVLLMVKGDGWFAAGGVSFAASHVLYIFAYLERGTVFSPWTILFFLLFGGLTWYVFSLFRQAAPRVLRLPLFLYLLANGVMNCFAWVRLLGGVCPVAAGAAAVVGAGLFYLSDSLLFLRRFGIRSLGNSHVPVMATYAVGQFLIAVGFCTAL